MKIVTRREPKPISDRSHDWSAIDDDTYDVGKPIGTGATEAEAIADLMQQITESGSAPQ